MITIPTTPPFGGATVADLLNGSTRFIYTAAELAHALRQAREAGLPVTIDPDTSTAVAPGNYIRVYAGSGPVLLMNAGKITTPERAEFRRVLDNTPIVTHDAVALNLQFESYLGFTLPNTFCSKTAARLVENGRGYEPDAYQIRYITERFAPTHKGEVSLRLYLPLWTNLSDAVNKAGLSVIWNVERLVAPVSARLTNLGIGVNRSGLAGLGDFHRAEAAALGNTIAKALDTDATLDDDAALQAALTSKGFATASLKAENLDDLPDQLREDISACRHHQTLARYAAMYIAAIAEDGRIHPTWDPLGAVTGRITATNPPVQSWPKGPEFRQCLIARPGYAILRSDYNGADIRPLAFLSKDARLIELLGREDIHREVAALLLDKAVGDVTDENRKLSKAVFLSIVNGGGPELISRKLDRDGADILSKFFGCFPGISRWQQQARESAASSKEVRTILGRRRLRNYKQDDSEWYRASLNTPIQGTVADAIKLAMMMLSGSFQEDEGIVAVLHDELIVEVRRERAEEMSALIKSVMESQLALILPGIPVRAEASLLWAPEDGATP